MNSVDIVGEHLLEYLKVNKYKEELAEFLHSLLDVEAIWKDYAPPTGLIGIKMVDGLLALSTAYPIQNDVADPMGFVTRRMPIPYKRALLELRTSELCLFGIQAVRNNPESYLNNTSTLQRLYHIFVESRKAYLGNDSVDLKVIEREHKEAEERYQAFLEEARASGQSVLPSYRGWR